MDQHGFEFTPAGIVPIGSYRPEMEEGHISGATAHVPKPDAAVSVQSPPAHVPRTVPAAVAPLAPRDVIRLARKRLREVEREIARITKLQKERDQLRRLLDAADGKISKGPGVLRDITQHRAG